jgi:SAM-dependent methyltransferase
MPLETFGLKSERFEILGRLENEHFWFVARRELFLGLLRQHVPQKVPVLMDLGCGYGLNLSLWGEFSEQVLGVDQHLAPETADISDRPDIIQGNVTDLSFDAQSADFALLLDTLEHVDDHAALAEVYRVLKVGGGVLISVPAHPWMWGARDVGASHLRRYSRKNLRATVEAAGFEIAVVRPYQFLLMPLVIASRFFGKVSTQTRDMEDRPPSILNSVFKWINRIEVRMSLAFFPMPSGSSYVLLARKKAAL